MYQLHFWFDQSQQQREYPNLEAAEQGAWSLTRNKGVYLVSLERTPDQLVYDRYALLERMDALELDLGQGRNSHE
jgi:hypothetical protein